jgi:hypothetical protein
VTLNLGLRYELDTLIWNEERKNDGSFYPRVLPYVNFQNRGDDNNVSPRLGVAWDVTGDGKTVVRAGYGRLFNTIMNGTPGAEETTLRQTSISINNPSYPDPYQGRSPSSFASTAPPNISIVSDDMVNPYADTISAGFSRQLGADMAINVDGVNTKSDKFNAQVAINTPVNGVRPLPAWGNITQVQSIGWQKYRALLVRLEKRLSSRYQYTLSYTLQKVTDNSFGNTSTGTITDAAHPEYDEGYGNADRRHSLVASGAYLLPGDVTLGMVWTLRSTAPFSARAGVDLNGDGAITDYVPGTHKGQGNRDLDMGLVNAWRAIRGLGLSAPLSSARTTTTAWTPESARRSRWAAGAGSRASSRSSTCSGVTISGVSVAAFQTNALTDTLGQLLTAQNRQQAEIAVRVTF